MTRRSEPPPSARDAVAAPLTGLRVLVVEDHAIGRILLDTMLSALGIVTTMVATGEEARTAARDAAFDLVLIDLGLPDVHGEQLAADLAAAIPPGRTLFVAVTGRNRPTVLPPVFDDWLEKPFSVGELHRTLSGTSARLCRSA